MATIDRDLVRAINSGRCFALVGAGPSCEIGLPSWSKLGEVTVASLDSETNKSEIEQCQKLLRQKDYPPVFSVIAKAIGLDSLLILVKKTLDAPRNNGTIYTCLAKWPFATYLTTNFDDHLAHYLRKDGLVFMTKHNTLDDFRVLRANCEKLVFKIHGDCSTPGDIVLTQEQYDSFRSADSREYWRKKIQSVLHMVDLVLFGYSASDPDFQEQLEVAKEIALPDHPVFMFAADVSDSDIRSYFLHFNIRIISYSNRDGTHRELHRVLKRYDPFIAKRSSPHLGQKPIDEEKARLASSMLLFTRLNISDGNSSCLEKAYEALIVASLGDYAPSAKVILQELQNKLAEKLHVDYIDPSTLQAGLESLHTRGLIEISPSQTEYSLSGTGREAIETTRAERQLRTDNFENACLLFLDKEFSSIDSAVRDDVIQKIERGLIAAFEKRGMEMAQATFGSQPLDLSTAMDILETVNEQSSLIDDASGRAACADLLLEILLQPSPEMKARLADLSQGYFSYHALGLDPECSNQRLEMAKGKAWILDSSIILPLLARDCVNHEFALDLLSKMKDLDLGLFTTGRLFVEVIDHAYWAMKNFENEPPGSPSLLQAAAGGPGYKQNLFVDGYIKWSLQQGAPSFQEYLRNCLGDGYESEIRSCIEERLCALGIENVKFSEWPDFTDDQWGKRPEIENKIVEQRKARGTYRSEEQCRAEAEVLILCEEGKAAFLSQSANLDSIDRDKPSITWKPESMYRFLASFSTVPPSEDLLYQSMVQDFFYSGFDIVNTEALNQYFEAPVRQSRLNLDEEKDRYERALGQTEYNRLRSGYEDVPDVQKPFYSMQFAFHVARRESENRERAEARAKRAEETKELRDKERKDYERLKAKEDAKKGKAKKNLRRQQSRSNARKKKKK